MCILSLPLESRANLLHFPFPSPFDQANCNEKIEINAGTLLNRSILIHRWARDKISKKIGRDENFPGGGNRDGLTEVGRSNRRRGRNKRRRGRRRWLLLAGKSEVDGFCRDSSWCHSSSSSELATSCPRFSANALRQTLFYHVTNTFICWLFYPCFVI